MEAEIVSLNPPPAPDPDRPRMDTPLLSSWRGWVAPVVAVGIAVVLMIRRWGFAIDDPWITFRYGRNLARGLGLVFNPGVRLEGYSNFLLVIFAAVLDRLRLDPFDFVRLGGFLCLPASVAVVAWGERRIALGERSIAEAPSYMAFLFPGGKAVAGWWVWAGTLFLALSPQAATWAVSGLETAYYLLAVVAAWFCAARAWAGMTGGAAAMGGNGGEGAGRRAWGWGVAAGVAALLAALVRVDGFVVSGGLAVFILWEVLCGRRPRRWGPVVVGGAVLVVGYGIYTIWRWSYFGAFIPNTALDKATGPIGDRLRSGVRYLFDWGRRGGGLGLLVAFWGGFWSVREWRKKANAAVDEKGQMEQPGHGEVGDGANTEMETARPGRVVSSSRILGEGEAFLRLAFWLMAAQTALILYAGGDWMPAARFVVPMLGFVGVLAGAGLRRWRRRGFLGWWVAAVAALWIVVSLWHGDRSDKDLQIYLSLKQQNKLLEPLKGIGEWLGAVAPPDAWVAGTEAGLVPYYSGLRFVDMLGLVDRHIAELPGGLHQKFDAEYVLDRAPRFILLGVTLEKGKDGWPLHGIWGPDDQVLHNRRFRKDYARRRAWLRDNPGGAPMEMVLYERKGG